MEIGILSLVWYVALLLPVILLFQLLKPRRNGEIPKIPGPPALPIIGNAGMFFSAPRESIFQIRRKLINDFGMLYKLKLGSSFVVNVAHANDLEVVMGSTKHMDKSLMYRFMQPWLGLGLLTSTGAKWHSHRKMITPTFHFKILENFLHVFNDNANIIVEKLQPEVTSEKFNVYPYITRCALDIICESAMGTKINAQSALSSEYVNAVSTLSRILLYRIARPWLYPDWIFNLSPKGKMAAECLKILHEFTNKVIKERKEERRREKQRNGVANDENETILGKKRREAFLDLLLEASEEGEKLTDQELREEVDTFMFEGHDTTATGMCWALYTLGSHPEIQEKVFEELREIFGDSDRPATMQDLNSLHYLERCIKETMRMYPSVPGTGRTTTEDCKLGNYTIPSGTVLSIRIYDAHHNPEFFPNPEKFDPDNFLPENVKGRHPYAYIPFSAGPRNCIGQKFAMLEEKTVISTILRKYKVTALDKAEDIALVGELILRPLNGINLRIEPRKYT